MSPVKLDAICSGALAIEYAHLGIVPKSKGPTTFLPSVPNLTKMAKNKAKRQPIIETKSTIQSSIFLNM